VNSFVEHAASKYGATRLQLDATVRYLLTGCAAGATNPAARTQGLDAVKALCRQRGPMVEAALERLAASADVSAVKAVQIAIAVGVIARSVGHDGACTCCD
jgi:hypothetical protein